MAKSKLAKHNSSTACPCGAGRFDQCCEPYLQQIIAAPTPEALMRSRYSAYVLHNEAYLRMSWHPDTCPPGPILEPAVKWLGLEVKASSQIGNNGIVEFVARHKQKSGQGAAQRLHEISRFVLEAGHWYYVDGQHE
jgi:SEC-C motif domain protein